jgi:hypothetical protein
MVVSCIFSQRFATKRLSVFLNSKLGALKKTINENKGNQRYPAHFTVLCTKQDR